MYTSGIYQVSAMVSAFVMGVAAAAALVQRRAQQTSKAHMRSLLGMRSDNSGTASLGWRPLLLALMKQQSTAQLAGAARTSSQATVRYQQLIVRAGVRESVTTEGVRATQRRCAALLACAGALFGMLFTPLLAVLLAFAGAMLGRALPTRALSGVSRERTQALEASLSQTIEVICLGLRAGLSFDRSLALYCRTFPGVFSAELGQSLRLWQAGMVTREDALRSLAETYDSQILGRVVDNIVRSVRFGSPLADSLEVLAVEARQAHRAYVEEAVMKAPVKMMVPVGALILPSMLMLVLGPVLLDLMNGF